MAARVPAQDWVQALAKYMRLLTFALLSAGGISAATCRKGHIARDYKMTEMSAPPRITGIGDSHLEITTKSEKAQAYFDQGFNLLHCFWDFEAYRSEEHTSELQSP